MFPEYAAYTVEGSILAYCILADEAVKRNVTVMTTLNLRNHNLPNTSPNCNYNTLFIFSRHGEVYAPQAKITPQSFEMQSRHPPYINVLPYNYLNRVELEQNGKIFTALFLICSDLYALRLFGPNELKSDAIICPANFGNGAEGSATEVITYAVQSEIFRRGFLCNTYQDISEQDAREGKIPLTIAVKEEFKRIEGASLSWQNIGEAVDSCSAIYHEKDYRDFPEMIELTQKRRAFAVPRSRSLENKDFKVELGKYESVVRL